MPGGTRSCSRSSSTSCAISSSTWLMGFAPGELNDLIGTPNAGFDPDEVPPAPVVPVSRAGEIWRLGPHRIMVGDCRESAHVEQLLDGRTINLAFTSPPYAEQREYDESSGFRP